MRNVVFVLSGTVAFCGLCGMAAAQEQAPPPPPAAVTPPMEPVCPPGMTAQYQTIEPEQQPAPARRRYEWSPYSQSITGGGGVADFVRTRISDNTSIAGTWDARYLAGTHSFLAFEASYMGSASGVDISNAANAEIGGGLTTQAFTGALRFNMTRARVQPFLGAGGGVAAVRRGNVAEFENVSLSRTTWGFAAPFSAGLSGYIGRHFLLEGRGAYTIIADHDYAPLAHAAGTAARPDMWSAELRAGYAF